MAEVISHRIPIGWYEGFYLYLYMGSILFLIFVYLFLLNRRKKPFNKIRQFFNLLLPSKTLLSDTESDNNKRKVSSDSCDDDEFDMQGQQLQRGSFYLRVGAVIFGIGSMIYSGLEFGQFFELESKEHCYNFLYGFTPGSHVAFTFIQLYFIFMNSRVIVSRHKLIGKLSKKLKVHLHFETKSIVLHFQTKSIVLQYIKLQKFKLNFAKIVKFI